jgi:hypothetical protein
MALVHLVEPVKKEVPHEPGNWFSFRPLSGDEKDAASDAQSAKFSATYSGEMIAALMRSEDQPSQQQRDRQADPLTGLALSHVMVGLVSWEGPHYSSSLCDEQNKMRLDDRTRRWAAREIAQLTGLSDLEKVSFGATSGASDSSDPMSAWPES